MEMKMDLDMNTVVESMWMWMWMWMDGRSPPFSLTHTDYVRDVFLLLNDPETGKGGDKRRDILMFLRELFSMAKTLQVCAATPTAVARGCRRCCFHLP